METANYDLDLVCGKASNTKSAGYKAFDEMQLHHTDTFIHFYIPTTKLFTGVKNPHGCSKTIIQLVMMVWYKFRKHIAGKVCRLLKSSHKLIDGVNCVVYIELTAIEGCKYIQHSLTTQSKRKMRGKTFSTLDHWGVEDQDDDEEEDEDESTDEREWKTDDEEDDEEEYDDDDE